MSITSKKITPIVSVVMPVYNCSLYLAEAIESILSQTFSDFEFIIIDDGSIDGSLDIIRSFSKIDTRIRVLENKVNKGIFFSRNIGLVESCGKYIAVMDSDDISLPTRFEKQVNYLEIYPEIDVLGTQKINIDEEGRKSQPSKYFLSPSLVNWGLLFGYSLCHSSLMLRKDIIDEGGFRYHTEQVAQDFDLLIRLSSEYKIANLPESLLLFRIHGNNISIRKRELQQQIAYEIIQSNIQNKIGESLKDEVISGIILAKHLKKHKQIKNLKIAYKVSGIIIKLMKVALKWDLTEEDRIYIKQNSASRLRKIWLEMHYHPFLLPYVVYSIFLDPDVIMRKIPLFKTQ